MAKNLNFLFALLVVIGIAWLALAARGCSGSRVPSFIDPKLTLDDALTRSHDSGKPVFALIAADWCPFCASLKQEALHDPRIASWIKDNTEPVYLDVTRSRQHDPQATAVLDRFNVDSIPAMILLQGNKQVGHIEGNIPADQLLSWLHDKSGRGG